MKVVEGNFGKQEPEEEEGMALAEMGDKLAQSLEYMKEHLGDQWPTHGSIFSMVVMGDDVMYFCSSELSKGDVLYMMETCKLSLLGVYE